MCVCLLQAHRHREQVMTGSAYVWILPQFSDPEWWRLEHDDIVRLRPQQRCSNYEMEEILNSTHVMNIGVYNHKFPTLDSEWNQTVSIVSLFHKRLPYITVASELLLTSLDLSTAKIQFVFVDPPLVFGKQWSMGCDSLWRV